MSDNYETSAERELSDELDAVRAERDQLQARIDAYEGHLEAWEKVDRLISQSSLGTPEAVAMRERTPPGVARTIVRASEYLARAEEAEAELDRLRQVVANTATDARILLRAIAMQSPDGVAGLAERIYQRHEPWDVGEEGDVSITCPRCGRTSHNPNDFAAGYCGACHDRTSRS